ncbi:MAG TPA: hypothetical protein DCS93_03065 [Microscillaceae bacterium]|nr:hypothetical protein [Microscillaceae bacterium]
MHSFFKIKSGDIQKSPISYEREATQLWTLAPFIDQASQETLMAEKFWQSYEKLIEQAKKQHSYTVVQQSTDQYTSSSTTHKKTVFKSRKPSLNLVGLLTDLVVAILVAPSSEATFMFCTIVIILHIVLILCSLPATKLVILSPHAIIIKHRWNQQQQQFLYPDIQSVSFYSRDEDSDKLYIETSEMEFCVDINIKARKIQQLFHLLQKKGITINTTL